MIDVIVPYRAADESRVFGFNVCMHAWDRVAFPVRVLVGGDGNMAAPFCKARAVNRLVASSNADKILLYGSDHLPPEDDKLAEISAALEHFPWVGCFSQHSTLSAASAAGIWEQMRADRWPITVDGFDAHAPFALGVIAVRRDTWSQIGGLDQRFIGWGGEDVAIREVLAHLHGTHQLTGRVVSTPHPAADRSFAEKNMMIVEEYRHAIAQHRLPDYLDETADARAGKTPVS